MTRYIRVRRLCLRRLATALAACAWTMGIAAAADIPTPVPPQPDVAPAAFGEVRVVLDGAFAPISSADASGRSAGYAIDLFASVARRAGLRHRFVAKPTFAEALRALRDREADVVVAAARNQERLAYASFVGPYYSAPSVIVTRLDGGWNSLEALADRKLAIDRSHYLIESIRAEMPRVRIVELDTARRAMQAVASGAADAMVTNIEVASRLINNEFLGKLQVTGVVTGRPSELFFAVRSDRPELAALLADELARTTATERSELAARWLRTTYAPGVPWRTIAAVGLPLLAALLTVIFVIGIFNGRLRAEVRRRRIVESDLAREHDHARAQAAAKADFLATVGHEIRTSLAALSGSVDLLQAGAADPGPGVLIGRIQRSSRYLVALLNDMLDYAKLDAHRIAIDPAPMRVGALVVEVVEDFEPLARAKGLTLRCVRPTEDAWVMADALRLRQVIANLVSNAIKYTTAGGVTVHHAQSLTANGRIAVSIDVADTGIGISAAQQSALFERYSRIHDAGDGIAGTGLGLAIVREIVHLMGGTVEVDSRVGQGSRFTVGFEAERTAAPQHAAPPASAPGVDRLFGRRIAIVEDEPVLRLVLAEQLKSMGCEVVSCATAQEAIAAVARERFDAIMTDLHLGGTDGVALAAALRQGASGAQPVPRLIAWTGDTSAAAAQACRQSGFDALLVKPTTMAELRSVLDRVLAQDSARSVAESMLR